MMCYMIYDLLVLLNVLIFYIRYTVSGSKKTEHSMTLCLFAGKANVCTKMGVNLNKTY